MEGARRVARRARQSFATLGAVFRNPNLRRTELAWAGAVGAEWAHFVAVIVFAYEADGTFAVGIVGMLRVLPAAALAPFATYIGDRVRRERLLVGIVLIGAAAMAGSAAAFWFDQSEVAIFALAAVLGVTQVLFRPAHQALLPSLARTPDELIAANGATSTVEGLGTLLGPLAAGVIVAVADVGVVFGAGGAAFLAAALLFARVRVERRVGVPVASVRGVARSALAGFETVLRGSRPRLVIGLVFVQTFVRGCLNVLIVVTVFRVLDAEPAAVGYLTAALGVGGLVGALASMAVVRGRLAVPFGLALVFWGLPIVLIAPRPYLVLTLVLLAVVGAANSIEDVAVLTLLQRIVPNDVLTRVLGVVWGTAMGAVALGSIVAPVVVDVTGPRAALVVVGAILPMLTVLSWRRLVQIDRTVTPPAALGLVEDVPMFAPLSLAAKEYIAAQLVAVPVHAGEVVLRAGERGDRFYVVAEGELDVAAGAVHRTMRDHDYFGEIALLRDIPRTATVTATADSRLYALEREDFLSAVTAHAAGRTAGEAVVDERLAAGTEHVRRSA
jgi:MFS family permease